MNRRGVEFLTTREKEAIEAFLIKLRARFPGRVSQAFLFGSKARGDSHPESDIDILLITDTIDWRFRHAISDLASDVSLASGVLIAPRVIEQVSWDQMARQGFSLYEAVVQEGLPLPFETP